MNRLITPFDPWKSRICTCPVKYSLNPYTGCDHRCLYCYSTYIPNFFSARPKKLLLTRLERELKNLPENALISMSNSSDPYPPMERELELTRGALKLMAEKGVRLLVITKSDIVVRDADILANMRSAVSITVTTIHDEIAGRIEPDAPKPGERIRALKELKKRGIPVILRLDPVMPGINEDHVEDVLERADFVDHVVASTLKLRRDSFARISREFPEIAERYRYLYFAEGEKIGGSWYLRRERREELLSRVAEKCEELGMSYAFCREGIPFRARSCDGSHLIA
ncbi:radical SAM protein [Geoglobus acetivorans]|uniref:Radical SAM protein n=1 Tax=Geoglobus acetivorans TaxID=565033 RepID=A0ABZ3H280_GEOAI|nr:radical SAM protein [Geoglobus acetivorans]